MLAPGVAAGQDGGMLDTGKAMAFGLLSLVVNIVLMGVKIAVGLVGNSYAMVADGIESGADILSTIITWAGFQLSLRPADEDHPFGHGKIESLAGMFSGVALLAAAGVIAWHSVAEIRAPHHAPEWFTLPVLLAVVAAKVAIGRALSRFGSGLDSRALEGDAWHHLSDALTSGAAAVGISIALIGGEGWEAADDYAALFACVVIVFNGLKIARGSLHEVLDGKVSETLTDSLKTIACGVPGVVEVEKCRTRKSGIGLFVELHARVDGTMSVREGHRIAHAVKDHLKASKPSILDVVVHIEPF